MGKVRPKKHLGQHFLTSDSIAFDTAKIALESRVDNWLEIGPGTGVLTQHLLQNTKTIKAIELDKESVIFLQKNYPNLEVLHGDYLKLSMDWFNAESYGIIGNFPYNISSQIVFKILENVDQIPIWGGMFQWEVGQRIAAKPNSKIYGILSVLTQAYYDVEMLFKVKPGHFNPPPKVDSGVVRAIRNNRKITVDMRLFFTVVKTAFGQRRKTLSNALKPLNIDKQAIGTNQMFKLRAENLSVDDFITLTQWVSENRL